MVYCKYLYVQNRKTVDMVDQTLGGFSLNSNGWLLGYSNLRALKGMKDTTCLESLGFIAA